MTRNQQAQIEWRDGAVPVSTRFDDPYFSLENGLAETRHVFLAGNGLPGRFREGFHIAELGFGTGLNMLAALIAWQQSGAPGKLRFTSFEAYPMAAPDIARAPVLPAFTIPAIKATTRTIFNQKTNGPALQTPPAVAIRRPDNRISPSPI